MCLYRLNCNENEATVSTTSCQIAGNIETRLGRWRAGLVIADAGFFAIQDALVRQPDRASFGALVYRWHEADMPQCDLMSVPVGETEIWQLGRYVRV